MVKIGQRTPIPEIRFKNARWPLGLEAFRLEDLVGRVSHDELARPQRPEFHVFVRVTAGRGSHTVDFVRHRIGRGSLVHIAPGQVQQFGLEPGLEAQVIVFEPDFLRRTAIHSPTHLTLTRERGAAVGALFDLVGREYGAFDGRTSARALLHVLLEALILAVNDSAAVVLPAAGEAPTGKLFTRFQTALERSFSRVRDVAAYATVLDCSPRTLTRACERASGRSAKQVIDERVVLEAKRLLAHGTETAADISLILGFAEPTQFGKFFARLTGESPTRFRARFPRVEQLDTGPPGASGRARMRRA